MISDELGYQLHDRATHGEELAKEDQARLEAWYAAQDCAEMEQLGLTVAEGRGVYTVKSSPLSGAASPVGVMPAKRRAVVADRTREIQLPVTPKPRTVLGRRLWEMRARIVASGEPLLGWEDIKRELAERRGQRE
jgi:hypothetical protein